MKRLVPLVLLLALCGSPAQALRVPSVPRCAVFPKTNAWNKRVDALPVAPDSDAIIHSIGAGVGLHPDFGSGLYQGGRIGIPFDVVTKRTPRVRVTFDYADESDKGPYPIPRTVHVESGSDRHALLIDRDACKLYELYALTRTPSGWHAGSVQSGAWARTGCGRRAGRPPTPPGSRSSPAWHATTRSPAA